MKKFLFLFIAIMFAGLSYATDVTEDFEDLSYSHSSTNSDYTFGEFSLTNGRLYGSGRQRNGSYAINFDDDSPAATLTYNGSDGNGKDGGVGTISLWYRHWDADGKNIKFKVQYSQNGGTSWIDIGSEVDVTSTTYAQFSNTINISGDNILIRVLSTAYAERLMIDDMSITDYASSTPTITTAATLSDFSYYLTYGPSAEQSFTVEGSNLTSDIVITAPTNYEISTTLASGFGTNLTLTQTSGTVATTTIYARLKSGLIVASYDEIINITSTGATALTVTCNGEVTDFAGPTNLEKTCVTNTTVTLSWDSPIGSVDGVLVAVRNSTLACHSTATLLGTITPNSTFGLGTSFGTTTPHTFVAYVGTGNSVTITGLTPGENYTFKVYSYIGALYSASVTTTSVTSLSVEQVNGISTLTGDAIANISWINADCFDDVVIVVKDVSSVTAIPSGDGTAYTANSIFGSGYEIATNEYVTYNSNTNSQTITGLTNGNTYYVKIFSRKGNEWSEGIEVAVTPQTVTILNHNDLAIVGINTGTTLVDEIQFVCFVNITPGTTIDLTDNGYERDYANQWGDTEGTVRITRKTSAYTLTAGNIISLVGESTGSTPVWGTDFNIYINGVLDNSNWDLDGTGTMNLNTDDQVWIMQGGNWNNPSGDQNATYSGNVLYGWTAIGWKSSAGYSDTKGSTLYPGCNCSSTDVTGVATSISRVKYTGITTITTIRSWIGRFNNANNWTGYADDTSFDAGGVLTNTISISPTAASTSDWLGDTDSNWNNCLNWYSLRIPDQNTDVIFDNTTATKDIEILAGNTAECKNLLIKGSGNKSIYATEGATSELHIYGNLVIQIDDALIFDDLDNNTSDATLIIDGNWTNTAGEDAFWEGNSLVIFGGSNSNITTTETSEDFYDVQINMNLATSTFTLDKNLNITNQLDLTKGIIITSTNMVELTNTSAAKIINPSSSSYINGILRRHIGTTAGDYRLAVGNSTCYEPAILSLTSAASVGYLDVSFNYFTTPVADCDIACLGLKEQGTLLTSLLDAGYWTVSASGLTTPLYDMQLNIQGCSNALTTPEAHTIVKRANSSSDWALNGTYETTQCIISGVVSVERSAYSSFSDFAVARGATDNGLPIELMSFEVSEDKGNANVEWTTASELNNDYFVVQKSQDGVNFIDVETILGAGTSNQLISYSLIDNNPFNRVSYYRLMQIDYDGTTTYSDLRDININSSNTSINAYSDINNNIVVNTNTNENFHYILCDVNGREVIKGEQIIDLNTVITVSKLPQGLYYFTIFNNNNKESFILRF